MMLTLIILAFSASIDAFSIGITYGLKNIKLSNSSRLLIFLILFISSSIAIITSNFMYSMLPDFWAKFISSSLLILLGFWVIYKAYTKEQNSYDFDNSNIIDIKESIYLGSAIATDAFCVGLGCRATGLINYMIFPIAVVIFHFTFLSLGISVGKKIYFRFKIPQKVWNIISGVLLCLIGCIKFFI